LAGDAGTKKNHLAVVFFRLQADYCLAGSEAAAAGAAGADASAAGAEAAAAGASTAAGAAAGAASSFLPQAARAAAAIKAAKTRDLFIFKDFSELTKQFPEIVWMASHPALTKSIRSLSTRA
jgi:hypothetical protein